MGRRRPRVSAVSHRSNAVSGRDPCPLDDVLGFEVGEIKPEVPLGILEPDDAAPEPPIVHPSHASARRRPHLGAPRGEDVDTVVSAAAALSRRPEGAPNRLASQSRDRELERRDVLNDDSAAPAAEKLGLHAEEIVAVLARLEGETEISLSSRRDGRRSVVAFPHRPEEIEEDSPVRRWVDLELHFRSLPALHREAIAERKGFPGVHVERLLERRRHLGRGAKRELRRFRPVAPEGGAVEPRLGEGVAVSIVGARGDVGFGDDLALAGRPGEDREDSENEGAHVAPEYRKQRPSAPSLERLSAR